MASANIFCGNCGAQNPSGHKFCYSCGSELSSGSSAASPTMAPTGSLSSQTLLKQRYRILQPLGKGGMGAVYAAQDTQLGDRTIAVKEMSQNGLPAQMVQTAADHFKQEAHLLAKLHHPNLPEIYDYFEQTGRWYLVMSFIEGETLADYLKRMPDQKLPLAEVLQIGLVLCNVLDYLHSNRPPIIFRDLKPANIMRMPNGHIYLIDFGIARHFKPDQEKDTAYYGSAGYSPPEQYGRSQTTERSDIYSLGATLYQLASGYHPATAPFRLPPLQSLVPGLPAAFTALVMQMLSLDEQDRPASIKIVQQQLRQIADSSATASTHLAPVSVPPPATTRSSSDVETVLQRDQQPRQVAVAPPFSPTLLSILRPNVPRLIMAVVGLVLVSVLGYWTFNSTGLPVQIAGINISFLALLTEFVIFLCAAFAGPIESLLFAAIALVFAVPGLQSVFATDGTLSYTHFYHYFSAGNIVEAFIVGLTFTRTKHHYLLVLGINIVAIVVLDCIVLSANSAVPPIGYAVLIISSIISLCIALVLHYYFIDRKLT